MSFITRISEVRTKVGDVLKKTYGPLAPLDPQERAGALRYPLDLGDTNLYPHAVLFECYKPLPLTITDDSLQESVKSLGASIVAAASGEAIPPREAPTDASIVALDVNRNQSKNSRLTDFYRRVDPNGDMIALYIPAIGPQDIMKNDYRTIEMTKALGNLGLAIEAGSKLSDIFSGEATWADTSALATEISTKIAERWKKLGNIVGDVGTLRDVGLATLGYAVNPQFEVLYNSTQLRTFHFAFSMTPRSKKEAEVCQRIIKKLKYHASPEYVQNEGRYIVPPSYFNIRFQYMGTENENLFKISTCVLTAIEVNYSPTDQFATYKDGNPVQIQMNLFFTELEPMHKALREEGY